MPFYMQRRTKLINGLMLSGISWQMNMHITNITRSRVLTADTNMNEIPSPGVTVLISNDSVTVTSHEFTVEE